MSQAPRRFVDFETRSRVDLKRQGLDVYAHHPSTEIICMAWEIEGGASERRCRSDDRVREARRRAGCCRRGSGCGLGGRYLVGGCHRSA